MPVVSISEAARLSRKGRKTIQRYVADGRISLTHDDTGKKGIEISELIRVFGGIEKNDACVTTASVAQLDTCVDTDDSGCSIEDVSVLKAEIQGLKVLLQEKDFRIDDLKITLRLLENKADKDISSRRWWKFWS